MTFEDLLHRYDFGTLFAKLRDDTDGETAATFVFDGSRTEIIKIFPDFIGELNLYFIILFIPHIQLHIIL